MICYNISGCFFLFYCREVLLNFSTPNNKVNKQHRFEYSLLTLALFSGLSLCQSQALAETDSDKDKEIETLVIKGSKRPTNFIDSELAATVIDSVAIDEARLREFRRIDDLVPNLQFNESGQRGNTFITIRGVESNPFIVNRAAVYIDGIPFRELNNSVLNQIASVEVLRGPQGTLYGANTESGLIIVNTKPVSEDFTSQFRVTASNFSSGNTYEADGYISGKLSDNDLSGSLAFNLAKEDAYIENIASGQEAGQYKETFIQGRLNWQATEKLTVNTTAYWLKLDAPGIFDQQYVPLNIELYNKLYGQVNGKPLSAWSIIENAPKDTQEEELVAGVSANYQLAQGSLDFSSSYRELKENARGLDFDLTAMPAVAGQEIEYSETWQAEVRYSSEVGGAFDYIIGSSYYDELETRTLGTFVGPGDINSYNLVPEQKTEGTDLSLFGSANWYPVEKLKLSFGVRFDRAKRETLQKAGTLDLGYGSTVDYKDAELSKTFNATLPKVAALYKYSENFSYYASVAKGYIPGGFNLAAVQKGIDDEKILSYQSETLWSRELGFKWYSPSKNLRASGAVFYITSDNWQEIQIAMDGQGRPVSSDYIGSNASIRSQGVELEGHWSVNDAFSVDAHLGVVDAEYERLQLDENTSAKGKSVQFVPDYDAGFALRYEWDSGFYTRLEASFIGDMSLRARGDAIQDSSSLLGLQIGYLTESVNYRVFVENLTDERRASGLAIENLAFGTDGLFYAPLDAPRKVGFELEFNY